MKDVIAYVIFFEFFFFNATRDLFYYSAEKMFPEIHINVHSITSAVRARYFPLFSAGKFTMAINSIVASRLQYISTITVDTIFMVVIRTER